MSETPHPSLVTDNRQRQRFELVEGGEIAFADYRREGDHLVIAYVEAPPALRGTGAAGRLMAGVVAHAQAEGLSLIPLCGYAAAWLRRHPERGDAGGFAKIDKNSSS